MSESLTIVVVFMGVIVITAVVFAVWLVAMALRLIGRGILSLLGIGGMTARREYEGTVVCPRDRCQALNPSSARFCRRCGRELLRGYRGW